LDRAGSDQSGRRQHHHEEGRGEGLGGDPIDTRQYRNALGRFATGIVVVTAHDQDRTHGMTVNAFTSVSLDPPLVLVSLDNRSSMHRILPRVPRFGISILREHQEPLSNHFAGRIKAGLHVRFFQREGVPLIEEAIAHFVVETVEAHPAGDHTLYIARVEHFDSSDGEPLLFYGGRYHHLRPERGKERWPEDEFSLFSIGSFDPPVG
jgi:flavin reductase (DIM6/NTAB) family NADH-FMN oxidoreductase RutF